MNSKVLSLLGFACKAGRLSFGTDAAKESLASKYSKLIVVAADVSAKSFKEMAFFAGRQGVEILRLEDDMQTVSHATGHKGGILSVNDEGFAKAIKGGIAHGTDQSENQ